MKSKVALWTLFMWPPPIVIWKLFTKKRREVHCHLNFTAEKQGSEKKEATSGLDAGNQKHIHCPRKEERKGWKQDRQAPPENLTQVCWPLILPPPPSYHFPYSYCIVQLARFLSCVCEHLSVHSFRHIQESWLQGLITPTICTLPQQETEPGSQAPSYLCAWAPRSLRLWRLNSCSFRLSIASSHLSLPFHIRK